MDSCRNPQVTLDEMLKWKKRTEHLETQLAAQADEIDQLKAVVDNLKEEITDKDCTIGSQAELIREAAEVVRALSDYEPIHDGFSCHFCQAGFFTIPHQPNCSKIKAAAMLPRLEAVGEKP
jgi:hypothetical protein